MSKYISRKFLIVMLFTFADIAGLFLTMLTGAEFITLASILVASFTAGDVAMNAIHKKNTE